MELIQSSIDGYDVCLFAYGQTGSGKTHTMQGLKGEERGIIPRAIELFYERKEELEKMGWVYSIEISYIEIYNETIQDLLTETKEELDVKDNVRKRHIDREREFIFQD